jgi:cellulose synthase/poly-beta-1,6-N-acetylglucosamine synthase-like glycosyltransferase
MRCGFCGTEVMAGYSTCPSCRAFYSKEMGFIVGTIVTALFVGIVLVLFPLASSVVNMIQASLLARHVGPTPDSSFLEGILWFVTAPPISSISAGCVALFGAGAIVSFLTRFIPSRLWRWRWVSYQSR